MRYKRPAGQKGDGQSPQRIGIPMNRLFSKARIVLAVLLVTALLFGMSGCGKKAKEWEYHPITDINNLEGRRVGVNLAWEADFLLSGREDLTVVRYDSFADIILGLEYNKIDAFAVDALVWELFRANSSGLKRVEPSCGEVGYVIYFSTDMRELMEDFNSFLADYRQSEAYADHISRLQSFDGFNYIGPDIPLTGTGETLKVATMTDQFPRCYIEAGEDIPTGYDMEALKLFVNERNYNMKFYFTSFDDIMHGLRTGGYDIGVGYLSDVYKKEIEDAGMLVSDMIDKTSVYFVEKTQKEIDVAGVLSEIE